MRARVPAKGLPFLLPNIQDSPSKATDEVKTLADIALNVQKAFESVRGLKIESREMTFRVPERLCEDDIAVRVRHPAFHSRSISFPISRLRSVTIHTLGPAMPPYKIIPSSIIPAPVGFDLKIESVPKDVEYLFFKLEYELPSSSFSESIVRTDSQLEAYEDLDTYWMHACLKHPVVLGKVFRTLNLKDVDFNVDVAIGNTVKTAIPSYFIRQCAILREIASLQNRSASHQLIVRNIQARKKLGRDPYEVLSQIDYLMSRQRFKDFVEIKPPFRFFDLEKGAEYEPNSQVFPNEMRVVSRTDLSLEKPASDGKLVYKKKEFGDEIGKLFP